MRKKFFYSLYSADGEKILGTYNSLGDVVVHYYGISRNNPKFNKKLHSLHTTIYYKKKAKNPKKWIIYKIKIEDEENGN